MAECNKRVPVKKVIKKKKITQMLVKFHDNNTTYLLYSPGIKMKVRDFSSVVFCSYKILVKKKSILLKLNESVN